MGDGSSPLPISHEREPSPIRPPRLQHHGRRLVFLGHLSQVTIEPLIGKLQMMNEVKEVVLDCVQFLRELGGLAGAFAGAVFNLMKATAIEAVRDMIAEAGKPAPN